MPQYKTAAQWSIANPVLLRGETGVESDTRKFKFGDGVNHWNDLEYANKAYPADIKMTDWAKMLESAYSPITNTDTLLAALQKLQVLVDNGDAYLFRCYGTNSTMSGVAFGSPDGSRGLRAICYNSWVNKILVCAGEITLPAFIRMSETEQAAWLGEHTEHSMPVEDILLGTNILNGSHEDWIESTIGSGYKDIPGGAIYLDHTLIRGKQITYRVELKGENAQATQLGFEIRVHFTDNTDQWIARYSAGDIPERGTFEKAYTFSSQIQDKEIEYARLYPVFRSLDGGEVSGKLYVRHEFVGVGNKLPSTWSPSVADQKKYIDDKVENIQIGGVNIFSFSELEQGAINNSTGVPAASNTRLRSKSFYPISGKYISVNSFNSIYKFLWLFYDEEYSHIDDVVSWNWITSFPAIAEIPEGAAYVKYMIVRNDNAVLTPDDAKEDCLIKVELGNKPSLSWSPSVADLQVTAPVTMSDFKNLPSVVTSAADGVIIPVITPASASNGPAGLSSTGPAYGYVQIAKAGSAKAYNFLVQTDGSGATKVYSGFLHSTAQTVSWTELGGNSGGRLRDVKYLGTSFWALISSNDTDIQAFVVDENSPEVPAEYKGEGFGFARHYRDDVGMATVTIKLNAGSVKTFNVTFYGDGSEANWEETGSSSGSSLPFDGPIPGYTKIVSSWSSAVTTGSTGVINFNQEVPANTKLLIEATIQSSPAATATIRANVPLTFAGLNSTGQGIVFEINSLYLSSGTTAGAIKLICTSFITGANGVQGMRVMVQSNNLANAGDIIQINGIYAKLPVPDERMVIIDVHACGVEAGEGIELTFELISTCSGWYTVGDDLKVRVSFAQVSSELGEELTGYVGERFYIEASNNGECWFGPVPASGNIEAELV